MHIRSELLFNGRPFDEEPNFLACWCRLTVFILYLQIINKRCRDIQSYFYHFHPSQQHPRAERGAKEVGVRHYRVRVVGPEQDSED